MENGNHRYVHGKRHGCEICYGQDGDEMTDPHTGDKFRVRVVHALPLKRRVPGGDEWRVEPVCEHCAEALQLTACASGAVLPLYNLENSVAEARKRNAAMLRLTCKTASIIRNYCRFQIDAENDSDEVDISAAVRGSR